MTIPSHLPGVLYGPAPRAAGPAAALSLPPRLVVIHDTSNTANAAAEAHYAATRTDAQSSWTSAHFYVDATGPLGSLPLTKQAWAAYSYANSHGWHIEMCGTNAGTTGAVPAVTIAKTAALVRTLCQLGGIPIVKLTPAQVAAGQRGICGHRDITLGLHVGSHDDPGSAFDWAGFINEVKQGDDMAVTDAQWNGLVQTVEWINRRVEALGRNYQPMQGAAPQKGETMWAVDQLRKVDDLAKSVGALASATGGLTDEDRAAIKDLSDAVKALAHQLATP